MKRSLHMICLFLSAALIGGVALISPYLPADNGVFVEKRYAGWSGVLRCWVAADWTCAGNFNSWLNRCAASFEKKHEGVYLEFTAVSPQAIREMGGEGLRPPEILFFSPGILSDSHMLENWKPLCMGGYIWVYNCALMDENDLISMQAGSMAELALLSGDMAKPVIPEPGIDLGLPVLSQNADISLDSFIDGEIPALCVNQAELARLIRMRENGRGPDWACRISGEYALANQLLLGGIVRQNDENASERTPLARDFLAHLLTEDCQKMTADIGAFPVTNIMAYSDFSPYSDMEQLLRSRTLLTPPVFSEYSAEAEAAIVRNYRSGKISAREGILQALAAGIYEINAYINR